MSNTLDIDTDTMCCTTIGRPLAKELFYVPQPSFIIPIFRAPTTTSTIKSITKTSTSKIITAILKHEQRQEENTSTSSLNLISQRIFENLILTNTIVAAFCIILMITLTGFLIFLLIPSIRRRWFNERQQNDRKLDDTSTLSRQPSFPHFTLGPSRLNPIFEPTTGATTTTTQFGPLFHPHTSTATVFHPTIWAPMTPTSVVSSPIPNQQQQQQQQYQQQQQQQQQQYQQQQQQQQQQYQQQQQQQQQISSQVPISTTNKSATTTASGAGRPPLPTHPPNTVQRSPKRR